MPFSNQPSATVSKVQPDLPTLQERYALRRCMADTALGKLYWAQDLKHGQNGSSQGNVLVFTLLPALAQNPVFEQVFGHILPTYQKPAPGMPLVSDDGKTTDGTRWMVMQNIGGMLLSERLAELDERGMPFADVMELLDNLATALANQRPEGIFGYLEPGTVLLGEKIPCLLTAPVVGALRAAYNSNPSDRTRQTLHSGYISPEVLLGDLPTPEDDTFSIAAIAYHLLQGEAPFGKQSTLEATVRNLSPSALRKLRPDAWQALQQGLNLKRTARPKTPNALLRTLQRKQKPKLLLPVAALVAASAAAFTSYHLLSSFGSSEQAVTPALDQASVQREADKLAAVQSAALAEAERLAAAQAQQASTSDFNTLLEQAATAIRSGKLTSDNPDQPAAVDYLRKAVALQPDDTKLQKLLAQMINDQHSEAETLLTAGKLEDASKVLATADRLITEFTLADSLKRQVSLETEVEQAKRKAALTAEPGVATTLPPDTTASTTLPPGSLDETTTQVLERAQRAIDYGNLNSSDERSESAIAYLRPLLDKDPKHAEARKLLETLVAQQQDKASSAMRKRDSNTARTWLDDSQSLIGKYQLDDLVEEQIALEKRYRETLAMGVFTPGSEPAVTDQTKPDGKTDSKPATTNKVASPNPASDTRQPSPTAVIEHTEAAPVGATGEAPAEPVPQAAAPVTPAPVEVPVSADIPIQGNVEPPPVSSNPPPPAELPPIQLDTQTPASAPPMNVDAGVPPAGRSFTPDVPELQEVPLDVIKEGLSTKNGQTQ